MKKYNVRIQGVVTEVKRVQTIAAAAQWKDIYLAKNAIYWLWKYRIRTNAIRRVGCLLLEVDRLG